MGFLRQKYWSGLQVSFPWYSLICKGNAHYATGLLFYYCYYWHCQFFCQQSIWSYRRFNIFNVRKVQQQTSLIWDITFPWQWNHDTSSRVALRLYFEASDSDWSCYFLEISLTHACWEIFTGSWKEDIRNNVSILNDIAHIVSSESTTQNTFQLCCTIFIFRVQEFSTSLNISKRFWTLKNRLSTIC